MALSRENLKAVIEAILFLTEEPVRADKIASGLGISSKEAQNLLCELQQELIEQQRGLRIFEVAGGYQMGTAPELAPYLEQAVSEEAVSYTHLDVYKRQPFWGCHGEILRAAELKSCLLYTSRCV